MSEQKKSREEVEALKVNWCDDPCWDIAETEGFEEYAWELTVFQTQKEAEWADAYKARLTQKAADLGVPGNLALAEYITRLEDRLAALEGARL